MSQHFLLTAKSRAISELEVARMSEDEARETFEKLRWSDTVIYKNKSYRATINVTGGLKIGSKQCNNPQLLLKISQPTV
jgi:hypothetical protein